MITVDTHMPYGYICNLCGNDSDFQYYNTISCASRQVSSFVDWIKKQDFYDNTTIVITGDHITMAQGVTEQLNPDCERKTYTCIINPAVKTKDETKRREYTIFDLYPTTIAALGATIKGDRLALGTNLFSDKETLSEMKGAEAEVKELDKKSDFLDELETYDEGLEELIQEFGEAGPPEEIKVDANNEGNNNIYIRTESLKDYKHYSEIEGVSIKIWQYNGGNYITSTHDMTRDENGAWYAGIDIRNYSETEKLHYLIRVKTKGAPAVRLGSEGSLDLK